MIHFLTVSINDPGFTEGVSPIPDPKIILRSTTITYASTFSKTNLNFKTIESTKSIAELLPFIDHQPNQKNIVFNIESNQLLRSDLKIASLAVDLGTDKFSVGVLSFDEEAKENDTVIKNLSEKHPEVLLGSAFDSETVIKTTESRSWQGHEFLLEICKRGGLAEEAFETGS